MRSLSLSLLYTSPTTTRTKSQRRNRKLRGDTREGAKAGAITGGEVKEGRRERREGEGTAFRLVNPLLCFLPPSLLSLSFTNCLFGPFVSLKMSRSDAMSPLLSIAHVQRGAEGFNSYLKYCFIKKCFCYSITSTSGT